MSQSSPQTPNSAETPPVSLNPSMFSSGNMPSISFPTLPSHQTPSSSSLRERSTSVDHHTRLTPQTQMEPSHEMLEFSRQHKEQQQREYNHHTQQRQVQYELSILSSQQPFITQSGVLPGSSSSDSNSNPSLVTSQPQVSHSHPITHSELTATPQPSLRSAVSTNSLSRYQHEEQPPTPLGPNPPQEMNSNANKHTPKAVNCNADIEMRRIMLSREYVYYASKDAEIPHPPSSVLSISSGGRTNSSFSPNSYHNVVHSNSNSIENTKTQMQCDNFPTPHSSLPIGSSDCIPHFTPHAPASTSNISFHGPPQPPSQPPALQADLTPSMDHVVYHSFPNHSPATSTASLKQTAFHPLLQPKPLHTPSLTPSQSHMKLVSKDTDDFTLPSVNARHLQFMANAVAKSGGKDSSRDSFGDEDVSNPDLAPTNNNISPGSDSDGEFASFSLKCEQRSNNNDNNIHGKVFGSPETPRSSSGGRIPQSPVTSVQPAQSASPNHSPASSNGVYNLPHSPCIKDLTLSQPLTTIDARESFFTPTALHSKQFRQQRQNNLEPTHSTPVIIPETINNIRIPDLSTLPRNGHIF